MRYKLKPLTNDRIFPLRPGHRELKSSNRHAVKETKKTNSL